MIILQQKQNNPWVMSSFIFLFLMNNKVTVMPLEERKKYTCVDGHPFLFLFFKTVK
jgi:hypothetical protein